MCSRSKSKTIYLKTTFHKAMKAGREKRSRTSGNKELLVPSLIEMTTSEILYLASLWIFLIEVPSVI